MPLPVFTEYRPATLLEARPAAEGQSFVTIQPPPGFLDAYERAGQFCKIRVGEYEGIFAMYSTRREPLARFLIRVGLPEGGEAADALAALPDGAPIEMTMPAGEGFALEKTEGCDVHFVATGTGVAPIRVAIEEVLDRRPRYGTLTFDYGVRSDAHLAVGAEIERWRRAGVHVEVHHSAPDERGIVRGTTVQEALTARADSLAGAAIVAVGQPEMLEALRHEALRLGAHPERFLTNL